MKNNILILISGFLILTSCNNDNDDYTRERVVLHSATCNHKKSHDGIEKGGKRLSDEIQEFIQNDVLMTSAYHEHGHGLGLAHVCPINEKAAKTKMKSLILVFMACVFICTP